MGKLSEVVAARDAVIESAELVADLASLEWQEADGRRMGATDNQGQRLYFVSPDLIEELRARVENLRTLENLK